MLRPVFCPRRRSRKVQRPQTPQNNGRSKKHRSRGASSTKRRARFSFFSSAEPTRGLISERAQAIVARAIDDPKDPFQFLRIAGDDLAADPLPAGGMRPTPFRSSARGAPFSSRRARRLLRPRSSRRISAPPSDCTIVIEAGAIKRDAPLRRFLEKEPTARRSSNAIRISAVRSRPAHRQRTRNPRRSDDRADTRARCWFRCSAKTGSPRAARSASDSSRRHLRRVVPRPVRRKRPVP